MWLAWYFGARFDLAVQDVIDKASSLASSASTPSSVPTLAHEEL